MTWTVWCRQKLTEQHQEVSGDINPCHATSRIIRSHFNFQIKENITENDSKYNIRKFGTNIAVNAPRGTFYIELNSSENVIVHDDKGLIISGYIILQYGVIFLRMGINTLEFRGLRIDQADLIVIVQGEFTKEA